MNLCSTLQVWGEVGAVHHEFMFLRTDQAMVAEVQKITLQKLTFEGKLEKSCGRLKQYER